MSEQALISIWDSLISNIVGITKEMEESIIKNSKTFKEEIISQYNKFPEVINEKVLNDFDNVLNKLKEEYSSNQNAQPLLEKISKLESIINSIQPCDNNDSMNVSKIIIDANECKENIESLTEELITEKNRNNFISQLQTQINTNKIKLWSTINHESRDMLSKQIKRDEDNLEKLMNEHDRSLKVLQDEISQLTSKNDRLTQQNSQLAIENRNLKSMTENLQDIEVLEKRNNFLNNKVVEYENNIVELKKQIENNEFHEKYQSLLKDFDSLREINTKNIKIINDFDMSNLDKNKELMDLKSLNIKLNTSIQNINQCLLSKRNSEAKKICSKAIVNNFDEQKEYEQLCTEMKQILESFNNMKNTLISYSSQDKFIV